MVFLAKTEPGTAGVIPGEELVWAKAGAEGAIEVHPYVADVLLRFHGDHFFVVDKPVKAAKKAEEPKAEEEVEASDAEASAEKPAPKKRTTTKE